MVQTHLFCKSGILLDSVTFQGLYQACDFMILYIMYVPAFLLSHLIFLIFDQVA